ncbi:branched-chain amino acid ABC transporter permease [Promicromonospora sukumoe]|uniref:branched-chain amino acid ABC transporter permease n=1 Tax=Promicromonospora sukumoe TaxID=88382 RepID=UPI00036D3D22|nr:branched-chain amino acid ABC transporter permease [Promicromonospora sukumoe]
MDWLNAGVQGVLLGGQYALLACGLSLIFGVMRIVNLAHGVLAVLAAYLSLFLVQQGLPLWLAVVVVVPVFAALGYAVQRGLFNPALAQVRARGAGGDSRGGGSRGAGELAPLLVSFGVAVALTSLLQEVFSADTRRIPTGDLASAGVPLGPLSVGLLPLITLVVAVAVIAGVQLFLARTPTGRAMRAVADDPGAAALTGVDPRHMYAVATAVAFATLALAGVFVGMSTQFSPGYGDLVLLFAFEAVIIGGLGSLWGTLAGGVVLGVAQTIGAQIDPQSGVLAGHLVFLAVLVVRPGGLLPRSVPA